MPRMASSRDQLVRNAEQLVHRRGFAATSVNDVLALTGVTKGAFYHHFPGKDDLELAVLERAGKAFLEWLDEVLAGPSPRHKLERFFASALKHHRKERFVGGCLFGNTALEMSDVNRRHADYVDGVFREWSNKIEIVIRAGQRVDQIRDDIPARDLAETIVATMEGGIMLSRLRKSEKPLRTCINSLGPFLWSRGTS